MSLKEKQSYQPMYMLGLIKFDSLESHFLPHLHLIHMPSVTE